MTSLLVGGVEKLREFNEENSDHFSNMYSEINHSLDPNHIFKFKLFKFCSISYWYGSARLGEYTVHLCLIIKLVGWNISFYVDTYRYIFKSDGRSELPRNTWSVRLPRHFLGVDCEI